ncbi:MAG TPA: MBOAT family O-acyltransferase, partial [Puia sp.]|nr:MBOAT family O-acyltransferase [Puia sp.]
MRTCLLLLASCYFYMSFVPAYILILGGIIVIDYIAGLKIAASSGKSRKSWLTVSIVANLAVLFFFKYFNFLLGIFEPLVHRISPGTDMPFLRILLPIGLSFHTFQAMSYTIEVYRGKQLPEKDFLTYALYVMFYPQLVAGPIERPGHFLPQLHRFQPYDRNAVREGLARMLWGFFKKVVIADRLAMMVDYCYNHDSTLSSASLIAGAIFYSFQIYCDFSGYCDIGIGAARVMGIRLVENFNEPYRSRSMSEFWTRWHISLSTWFRDYVYIPLGGNRLGENRRKLNVFFVFLLSGLWHGANWTFILWGGLYGLLTAFFPGNK